MTTSTGRFGSIDGFDVRYENNMQCEWIILAGENKFVQFTILDLDTEEDKDCSKDYISVSLHILYIFSSYDVKGTGQ